MKIKLLMASGLLVASGPVLFLFQNATSTNNCSEAELADILAEPTAKKWFAEVKCNAHFTSSQVIKKTLIIQGGVSNISIMCTHNKTQNRRTTLTRSPAIAEAIMADLVPAMSAMDIAAEDKANPSEVANYGKLDYLDKMIEFDEKNLVFIDETIQAGKRASTLTLQRLQDLERVEGKIRIRRGVVRTYRRALQATKSPEKTGEIYLKFRAVRSFETRNLNPVMAKADYLIQASKANAYLTDDLQRVINMRTSKAGQRILIMSESKDAGKTWQVPQNISIKNCNIEGGVRVLGMAPTGEDAWYRGRYLYKSALRGGHAARAQAAAPRNIFLENLLVSGGKVYFSPGVSLSRLSSSTLIDSTIYLDAESQLNTIAGNTFYSLEFSGLKASGEREFIAVDGSASNTIANNSFGTTEHPLDRGGVFIYRNCGENGVTRHQVPHYNVVRNNEFFYAPANKMSVPGVYVNSRYGLNVYYCRFDDGNPFGSGKNSNNEYLRGTKVFENIAHDWNKSLGDAVKVNNSEMDKIRAMVYQ